jgi:hypothetical protein
LHYRLRDAEREILFEEFIDKEEDILTGIIDRVDHRYVSRRRCITACFAAWAPTRPKSLGVTFSSYISPISYELNMDQGTFKVIARKDVVEEVFDDRDEVDLSTALGITACFAAWAPTRPKSLGVTFSSYISPISYAGFLTSAVLKTFKVIARKDVVEEVFDDRDEVDLSTALVKNPAYDVVKYFFNNIFTSDNFESTLIHI